MALALEVTAVQAVQAGVDVAAAAAMAVGAVPAWAGG
jgi:hypothetical protein